MKKNKKNFKNRIKDFYIQPWQGKSRIREDLENPIPQERNGREEDQDLQNPQEDDLS